MFEPKPPLSPDSIDIHFGDYWQIIRRRWKPAVLVGLGVMAVATVAALRQKPSYEAHGQLLFRVNRAAALLGFDNEKSQSDTPALTLQSNPLKTQTAVLLSTPLSQKTIVVLNLKDDKGRSLSPKDLINRLKVKELPGADVLDLQYKDSNSNRAAAVVNQLMQQYLAYNISSSRAETIAMRQFILQQIPKTEVAVRQADAAMRQFKERNGVTDLDTQTRGLVQNQLSAEDSLVKAQTELAATTARLNTLRQRVGMDAQATLQLSAISQSAGVQQALKEYQQTETDLQAMRGKYLDSYPQVVNLQRKQEKLKALIQQRVRAISGNPTALGLNRLQTGETEQKVMQDLINTDIDRQTVGSRINRLSQALNLYQTQAAQLPRLEQEQRELQRQLDAAQSTYQTLLRKLQETQVTENQNTGSAEIIEQAVAPDQASGKTHLILMAGGIIGGLLLAVLVIIGLELQDQRLKSVHEAKKLFDYKVLGDIPHDRVLAMPSQVEPIALLPGSDVPLTGDPLRSAYYLLQANLRFFSTEQATKVILVTSSVRKEGKSTVAANLAVTLSQLGHSVALVDADLHAPTQHALWRTEAVPGLSDVLLDGVSLPRVMRSLNSHLSLLPCGSLPVHPLALLDSDSMARLVQSLASQYTYVIVDSPPLLVDAEAVTLGKLADGVLLVVRPDQVDFASAKAAKTLLDQLGHSVLGVVMNAVEPQVQHIPYR